MPLSVSSPFGSDTWHIHIGKMYQGVRVRVMIAAVRLEMPTNKVQHSDPIHRIEIQAEFKAPWGKHHKLTYDFTRPSPTPNTEAPPP